MSPKTTAVDRNSHYGLQLVLVSSVCVVASISCILYAIHARTYIDRFSVRLAALELRCKCDTPSDADNIHHDDGLSGSGDISKDSFNEDRSSQSLHIEPTITDSISVEPGIIGSHVIINDATLGKGIPIQLAPLLHQKRKLKRSTPSNREFMNEEEDEEVSRADRRHGSRRRSGQTPRMRGGQHMTASTHQQPLALHFDGNASKYSLGHRHYEGNGRLRHPDGILKDWKMKEWGVRYDRQHRLHENDGTLMIRESGIYFVYAQIYYLDDHDINGFRILVNDSPVLQCTTMTHGEPLTKANTCFTGGMVELHAGDVLSLRDLAALRYSVFEQGKSFFGLFRVAHHMSGGREGP